MGEVRKVLLVDNEEEICEILSQRLEEQSYQVETKLDGLEAFDAFKKNNHDLIISDIKMPNCDGFQLLEKIRKESKDVKFIFMTGFSDYKKEELINRGANLVLYKPVSAKKLLNAIDECYNNGNAK